MLTLKPLLLLTSLSTAFAQYGNGPPSGPVSATPTPAASAASSVQTVSVGKDGLVYTPNTLTAAAGTTVEFHFFPPGHSVAQSSFESPCAPINASAFFSGGFSATTGEAPNVFTLTINDTTPLWFYCGVPGHCEAGMAGVINPPADTSKSLAAYQAAAAKVSKTTAPTTVQGGVVGPPKPVTTTSTSPPASTSTGAASALTAHSGWAGVFGATLVSVGAAALMV